MSWAFYAFLSALFAAATAILAKIGVKDIDSNLATAIRTAVIIVFAFAIVWYQGTIKQLPSIPRYTLAFLVLSGIATGLSWLFYFKALQIGHASQVAPIDKLSLIFTILLAALFLGEKLTLPILAGGTLMTVGALIITFWK
ncbi:MAG: EamA family transporter [Patescibacteria group bacterium]